MGDMVQNQNRDMWGSKGPYREIITKAVCGSVSKNFVYTKFIKIQEKRIPTKVLGTSIHKFELQPAVMETIDHNQTGVLIRGSFEVNIWYSFDQGNFTDVIREPVKLAEVIPQDDFEGHVSKEFSVQVMLIKSPQCKSAALQSGNTVRIEIELGVYVEVLGETKLRVFVYQDSDEDES
ncbi:outer spore coat protein [Desulfofarcimen acetoxidans DSM 771]|uniref:Outer spore coat protein n=1 Tax=Desulfofarcimen acetoxidans (strain ATCC 49208 / DSM 771 / KCTC 5769 / VKM B-1644 / 5575) TaxID=485916 RepID=C8W4E9_DESAS|nr:outer spore coat protein CotE [Desulfofarcimen acetoxidans]ACV62017.1 outer spore coat protein [Desulfofarcimen acetoxidans DSM 771]